MVAAITGNGLGLNNTSLTQLGQAQGGSPQLGQAANSSYVNTATGNLVLQSNDEGLVFDGLALNVLRTYNSLGQLNGNDGWTYGFSRNLNGLTGTVNTAGSTITRTDDDGASVVYTYNATLGVYQSTDQSGAIDTLSWNATSSTWTWTDAADSTQETYTATGQLTALTDTATGASYSFSYSNGQLSQITAGDGDTLLFGYNTNNQLISLSIQEVPPGQTSAVTRQAVSYGYDSQGRLTSVTTTLGSDTDSTSASYTTTYTYQGSSDLIASVTQSDGTTVSYSYTEDAQGVYQVTGVTTGTGSAAQSVTLSYATDSTTLTDGLGNVTTYTYNAAGELTAVIAPAVNGTSPTTSYTYDANGNLLTSTDPDGAVTTYQYDANGNLLSVEDGAGNTVSYTYNADDQVTSKTTYTVPAQGEAGQSGYVAPSGAQTTYYIYNATGQLAYTVDPLGNVSENDYTTVNGLSELTASRQYLGATYSASSNGNSPSNPPTLSALQSWVASSAVQSTLSQSTLTATSYDIRGQLATQTQYDTVDSDGNGVLTTGTLITTTTYDAQGKLLQTSTETGTDRGTLQTTSYAYDGLGRVITQTDPLGNITSYVYDDSANTLIITQANGLITTQVRNSAGLLVSSSQSDANVTIPQINDSVEISGASVFTTAQIAYGANYVTNGNGGGQWVTGEFVTVSGGGITRAYAIPLTAAQAEQLLASPTSATLASLLTPSANDQISLQIIGSNGMPAANVSYGTQTFTNPDGTTDTVTGYLAQTTIGTQTYTYATPLTAAQVDALAANPTLSALQAMLTSSQSDQIDVGGSDAQADGSSPYIFYGTVQDASGNSVTGEFIQQVQVGTSGSLRTRCTTTYTAVLTLAQVQSLGTDPTVAQIQALIPQDAPSLVSLSVSDTSTGAFATVSYQQASTSPRLSDGTPVSLPAGYYAAIYAPMEASYTGYATPLTAAQVASLGSAPSIAQIQALVTPSANDSGGYRIYNSLDQNLATILPSSFQNPNGTPYGYFVTLMDYDQNGNYLGETHYATPLTAAQLASLGSSPTLAQVQAMVTSSDGDSTTLQLYGTSEGGDTQSVQVTPQSVTITNPDGSTSTAVQEYVSVTTDNSEGSISIEYAIPLTPAQLASLGTPPTAAGVLSLVTPSANDQVSLNIFNAAGYVAAKVSYQTNYLMGSDGQVGAVTGEFLSIVDSSSMSSLYQTPLTAAQVQSLIANPTLNNLETIVPSLQSARTTSYVYDADGREIAAIDPDGNATYTFYNADGEVVGTVDGTGSVTAYSYDADGHLIQTIQYANTVNTSGWIDNGSLTANVPTSLPIPAASSGDVTTTNILDAAGNVVATINAAGDVTTTTYDGDGNVIATTEYATPLTSTQLSALGSAPTLAALMADVTPSSSDRTTLTIYNADGEATATIDPDGNVKVMSYDGAGDLISSVTYPTPLTTTEIEELRTAQSMSTLQLLLNPTSQTIYNAANQAVATISASGVVTVTSYDANGNVTASTTYATPLTEAEIIALGVGPTLAQVLAAVTPSADDATTLTVYNSSNQVVAAVNAQGQVTAYTYDAAGNVIATTDYADMLSATQVASLGTEPTLAEVQALITPSANDQTTYALYDSSEQPSATVSAAGVVIVTDYSTPGVAITTQYATALTAQQLASLASNPTLANLESEVVSSANDQVSLAFYNANGQKVATVGSTGQVILDNYDSAGDLTSSIGIAAPLTSAQLSALQQSPSLALLQSDLNQGTTTGLTIYNADNQPVATVSDGVVTVNTYDANGNLLATVRYTETLTNQQLTSLGVTPSLAALQAMLTPSIDDRISIYNSNNQIAATLYDGYVTTMTYDEYGNVAASITYDNGLTAQEVASIESSPSLSSLQGMLVPSASDEVDISIYDANHNLFGSVDNGYATITTYDANNEVVANTNYENQISTSQLETLAQDPTLAGLQAIITPSSQDQTTLTVRNADEQPAATVKEGDYYDYSTDAEVYGGQITVTSYDAAGNVTAQTIYANTLTPQQVDSLGSTPTLAQVQALITPSSYDETTLTVYDASERPVVTIAPVAITGGYGGSVTIISYNAAGGIAEKVIYATALTASQVTSLGDAPTLADVQAIVTPSAGDQVTTLSIYNDNNQLVATLIPSENDLVWSYTVVMSTYNAAGLLASTTQYANLLTASQVDNLEIDPSLSTLQSMIVPNSSDQTTLNYYNADNQLIATLVSGTFVYNPATGSYGAGYTVTTYTYDAAGNQTFALTNYQTLTPSQVSDLGSNPTQASIESLLDTPYNYYTAADVTIYNANEQVEATVDNGAVSTTTYNSDGEVSGTATYYYGLASSQIDDLVDDPTMANLLSMVDSSPFDGGSVTIYSPSGSVAAKLVLVQDLSYDTLYLDTAVLTTYDANGNVTSTTTYSSTSYGDSPSAALLASMGSNPTLSGVLGAMASQNSISSEVTIRNASGQIVGTVDGGHAIINTYDAAGNETSSYFYSMVLSQQQIDLLIQNPTLANLQALLVETSSNDSVSVTIYGANEQVLGTASTDSGITLNSYDANGDLLATQEYSTNLSVAQIQALIDAPSVTALQMDLYAAQGDSISQTFYNAAGQPIATIAPNGAVTTTTYDAAGNVTSTTQYANALDLTDGQIGSYAQLIASLTPSGADLTTRTIYNTEEQPVAQINASGQVTVITYNDVGNAVGSTVYSTPLTTAQMADFGDAPTMAQLQALLTPSTRMVYNAAGEKVATIDPKGDVSYSFYNSAGELAGTVDADGDVTAYSYDADGNLTQVTQYATPISTDGWMNADGTLSSGYPGSLPIPTASSQDRTTTSIYDSAGNIVAVIDPSGDVITTTYDVFGDAISSTAYATPLTAAQMASLGSSPTLAALQALLTTSANDRTTTAEYDADGREVESTDAAGYVTLTTYDADGDVVLEQQEIGGGNYATTRSYYDGTGRLTAQVDADGYLTVYSYDSATDTTTSTRYATALTASQLAGLTGTETTAQLVAMLGGNTANEQTSETYNADNQLVSSTAADGTVTTYQYDPAGQLIGTTITPLSGQGAVRSTSTTYDTRGDIISTTDADGNTTTYLYNANGQRIESTDAMGNSTWYYYDPDGRLIYTVQGQPWNGQANQWGDVTAYTYDAFGDVTSKTAYAAQLALDTSDPSNGSVINPGESTTTDIGNAVGALQNSSSDVDDTTAYTYTSDGQLASLINGDGYETDYSYDAFGDLVQEQQQLSDPGQTLSATNSTTTDYVYNADGEQIEEIDGVGSSVQRSTSTTYDGLGDVLGSTDGMGNTTTYQYDALGRQIATSQVVQGQTRATETSYDAFGRVLSTTDALGNTTTYSYNIATHATTMTTPDGVIMTTIKDAYGDTVSITDGEGNTTSYTYDADGNLLSTTDALGNVSTDAYDADGNLIQTTNADGDVVVYSYDASGRVLTMTVDPNGLDRVTTYYYDGEEREVYVVDPTGSGTAYYYDADGNVLTQVQDWGSGNLTTTYTYDGQGNTLTVTQGAGSSVATTTQYVYDQLGRMVQKIVDPTGLAITTTYAYDADNNLIATTDPYGDVTYTLYNEANEAVYTISSGNGPASGDYTVTQNTYDADGNLVSTTNYGNFAQNLGIPTLLTTASSGGSSAVTQNLAIGATYAAAASSSDNAVSYNVYNDDGQVIYQIDPSGVVTETRYNALGQAAETLVYASPIAIGGDLGQSLQAGTASGGEIQAALTAAGDSDGTARVSYAYYDADGRQIFTVVLNQVDGVLSGLVSYTQYDPAGLVAATMQFSLPLADVGAGATTTSIMQALQPIESTSAVRVTQYIYDTAGEQVAVIDPNGNVSYTFYDADGRIVATVNPTGTVVQYARNGLGQVVEQTTFANTVDTSSWLQNGQVTVSWPDMLPAYFPTQDHVIVTTYDAVGRVSTVSEYSQVQQNGYWVENNGVWSIDYTFTPSNGDTLTYTYDNDSRVVETTDVDISGRSPTRTTRYFYGTQQNSVATLNADGVLSLSSYDAADRLLQTTVYATPTDPSLDADGTLAQLIPSSSPNDETTSNYYDALGNLAGTLDADGYFTGYTYDQDGRQTSTTRYADALSASQQAAYRYSSLESYPSISALQAVAAVGPYQQSTETYDAYGDVLTSTDTHGFVTEYSYDNLGNVLQTTVAAGTSQARTTSNAYDAFGEVISTTDGLGNVTTYTYDANGNETSKTDALGNTTWYVYDQDNRLAFTIVGLADSSGDLNAYGAVSETIYDQFGDVSRTIDYSDFLTLGTGFSPTLASMQTAASGMANQGPNRDESVDYYYDQEGNVVSKIDGNNNETDYVYDGFNQLISRNEDGINGLMTVYTYDSMGNMLSQVDEQYENGSGGSSGEVSSSEEYADSIVSSGCGSGSGSGWEIIRTQEWTYDAFGNVASYTDGDGNTASYTYDDLNRQLTQSQFVSGQTQESSATYDAYGRILTSTDAMGLVTSYSYNDAADSVTEIKPGDISSTTVYNAEGQVSSVTDAQGNTTSSSYDADGNLIQTTNPDGSTITNQYDADGNLLQTTDADGNVTAYTYNAAGQVLTKTVDPNGLDLVTTYTYDGRGLLTTETDPTGVVTSNYYDGNGNLLYQVKGGKDGGASVSDSYSYNDLNEATSSTLWEMIGGQWQSAESYYSYDVLGRMTSESTSTGHASEIQYTYDADSNVTSQTDGNGNVTYYYYNQADQLIYTINPDGAVTYTTYNADGQVTSVMQYATELPEDVLVQVIGNGQWYLPDAIQTSPDDRTTYNVYNSAGQLAYTIDANGNVTQSIYNDLGQVIETLAYATPVQLSASDIADLQSGDVAAISDVQADLSAAGDTSSNARITYTYYDDMGRVACTLSSATLNGQAGYLATQTQYDADGNVIATIQYGDLVPASLPGSTSGTAAVEAYLGGLSDMHVTRTVYDAAGRAVYSINAAGDVTQTEYDADGRVTATLQYANAIDAPAAWTQADVAAAVQATNGSASDVRETQNVYDDLGNLIQTIDGDGNVTTYTYDERGLKLSQTDGNGNTTTYTYDQYGNLISQTSPPVAVASYSSTGAYQGTTTESLVTEYAYDNDGHLISEADAANTSQPRTTQYVYDAAGNLIQTIQPDPGAIDPQTGLLVPTGSTPTISITYNAFGQAVASEDGNGNVAYNVYDNDGNLLYAIDGDGYVTGYTYNAYGEQTSVTRYATGIDPAEQGWSIDQPPTLAQVQAALVTSSSDRTITTAYDAQGNKISVTEPDVTYTNSNGSTAQGSPVTQYTYDAYGNVTSQSVLVQGQPGTDNAVWATTYNYYDALNRVVMVVTPTGSYTSPMGYVTTNTYDAFGDVLSTTQWATAISTNGWTAGGTMPTDPPAGTAATTGLDRTTTYTYDNAGNKTSQSVLRSYTDAQGNAAVGWDTTTYGYDADNQLTTVTENGSTTTTAYDALGRISSVTGPAVEVLVDNWQSLLEADASLTLNSPQLYTLSSQVVSYAYDAFGDKLSQTQSATNSSLSVTTYYQYDNAGRMVAQLTPLDGSGADWSSDQAKFYAYDNNGNVVSEWYTLTGDEGSTTTVTTINTYDADNQKTSSVTWRAGIPEPDASTSTTYDAFGEVTDSGDGVSNNVVATYDNDGNKITSTDPTSGEVHTYGYNLAGQMVTDSVPVAASAGTGSVETIYTLDLAGRVTAEQAPSTTSATGENTGTLSATYDAWGNVLSSTDANGNTTDYTYNERNDVVTETQAAVSVMGDDGTATTEKTTASTSYDIEGNIVASTDADGNTIKNVYNAFGQKTEVIDGVGAKSYTSYDALGNAVATQDGNGNIGFTNVDALGRAVVAGQFTANGQGGYQMVWQQAYVLDQNGNRIVSYNGVGAAYLQSGDTADAALNANYDGYDSQGRVIWSQDPAQYAASTEDDHQNYAGNWTQTPTNANFSAGLTGWTFDPGYSVGSFDYSGQIWPLMFGGTDNANGGTGGAVNNDRVPVVPGQTITANGQFEVVSDNGNGEMFINWYNAEGQMIGQSSNGPGITGGKGSGINSVTGTAPAGAAYASIAIGCSNYNEGPEGVVCSGVWWDYVPPAGTTVLGTGSTDAVVTLPTGEFTDQADNTNFDQGNTGWTTNGWTIHTASNANSGWEASFNGDGTAVMVNQDRVPVVAGQTISASMQLGLYLAPSGAAAGGAIAINWYDANGTLITTDTGTWVDNDRAGAWETSYITSTAPPGAAYASLAVVGQANGIGSVSVENAQWNYQYIPQAPTGVVQDSYVYDMDGNLVSETTADGDTETWQYNQYGQVTEHTDLSGATYNYTYDAQTGQEIGESDDWSPTAQDQIAPSYVTAPISTPNTETLTYYADGQIATESFSDGSSYSYTYDANGNLISEQDTTVDGNDNPVQTLTQTTYDSHNRISSVTETNQLTGTVILSESFAYDAAGNRVEVDATSTNGSNQDAWYTYDADNRVLVTDGSLQNNQIVVTDTTGSYENAYDADGNVIEIFTKSNTGDLMEQSQSYNAKNELVETEYAVDVTQGASNNGVEETITYDANGNALVTSTYYEQGATITVQNGNTTDGGNNSSPPDDGEAGTSTVDVGGELENATVNFYDVAGQLAESQTFANSSDWDGTPVAPPSSPLDPDATAYGNLQYQSEVVYQGPNGTSGYDADGNVVAYQYRDNTGLINQYQVTYLKKDSYLQAQTEGVNIAGPADVQPATDSAIYDTRGDEVALEQHTEDPSGNLADTVHVFAYNGSGEIIESQTGTGTDGTSLDLGSDPNAEIANYTYVNGQQLASFNNDGSQLNVLDQVTAFSSNNDSPDSYVVQSGDTLESIAQEEYGNSNLWYVIAQANDLSSDTSLVLGQRLQIPVVTTHSNSATTFKPYDPSSIVGNTTPSLPQIAPPVLPADSSAGCSVAQILVLVVTIVVTCLTYGSTSDFLIGELGEIGGDAAAGALAGAAGSLAGQVTGNAEGIENGINWGAIGEAALGGAIAGGVTGGLQASGTAGTAGTFTTSAVNSADEPILNGLGDAVVGAASYVGNDVAAELTGQPENFSWAGLIASTVGAGVAGEISLNLPQGGAVLEGLDQATGAAVGDVVNRELAVVLGDQHVPSWAQVGEQVAAGFIAYPLANYLSPAPTKGQASSQQNGQGQQTTQSATSGTTANGASSNGQGFVFQNNSSTASTSWWNSGNQSNNGLLALDSALTYGDSTGMVGNGSNFGSMPFGATSYASSLGEQGDPVLGGLTDAQIEAMLYGGDLVASINGAGSTALSPYATPNNIGGFGPQPNVSPGALNPAMPSTSNPLQNELNVDIAWLNYAQVGAYYGQSGQFGLIGPQIVDQQSFDNANQAFYQSSLNSSSTAIDPSALSNFTSQINAMRQANNFPTGVLPPSITYTPTVKNLSSVTVTANILPPSNTPVSFSYLPPVPLQKPSISVTIGAPKFTVPAISVQDVIGQLALPNNAQISPSDTSPNVDQMILQPFANMKAVGYTSPPAPTANDVFQQLKLAAQPGFKPVEVGMSQRIYEKISQGNGLERFMGGVESTAGQVITGFLPGEDQYGNTHNVFTGQPILAADAKVNHIASIGGILMPAEEGFSALEKVAAGGIARIFRRSAADAFERIVPDSSVWQLNPFERGKAIEQALGHNLPSNYPVIDKFESGLATSIKSIDLNAASYQDTSALSRTLTRYVDSVAGFQGRTWAGVRISAQDISGRALDLVVPGPGTTAQQATIEQAVQYAASKGVKLNVVHYP